MADDRKTGQHYDKVAFTSGPKIYSSASLYDDMYTLGEFAPPGPFEVLDAMCGAGLVGKEMGKRLDAAGIAYTLHFVDLAEKKIGALKQEGHDARVASVLELPYNSGGLDRVYARFGVKNYPRGSQLEIFRKFRDVLRAPGIFVLTDMEAPEEAYDFMQLERRTKNRFTGLEGNEPHMPTLQDWYAMLNECGLAHRQTKHHVSYVTTSDWVKSNQMTPEGLAEMNVFLLDAPESARRALNIRQEGSDVKINYSVVVISAGIQ